MEKFKIDRPDDEYLAVIKNLTDKRLFFVFLNPEACNFDINPNGDTVLFRNDCGYATLRALENKNYELFER